jgi:hypothetical protein
VGEGGGEQGVEGEDFRGGALGWMVCMKCLYEISTGTVCIDDSTECLFGIMYRLLYGLLYGLF